MKKYIKDGQVAVLVSPGYGAGFSTRIDGDGVETNYRVVRALLGESGETVECAVLGEYPGAYLGGIKTLRIEWVPEGVPYCIIEYNGAEELEFCNIFGLHHSL